MLADATQVVKEFGYDAVNLNAGCPTKTVKNLAFGACRMEHPNAVFAIVRTMKNATELPVIVKCRFGTNRVNGYA